MPQDTDLAFHLFTKAAAQNYGAAYDNLGRMFEDGKLVEKDEKRMFQYYLKGASAGNARSTFKAGCCFAFGTGTEKDLLNAVSMWITGVMKGYPDGDLFLKSVVIDPNYSHLVKDYLIPYLRYQEPKEDACTLILLGHCCEFGKGVEQNPVGAMQYYTKAILGRDRLDPFEKELFDRVRKKTQMIK